MSKASFTEVTHVKATRKARRCDWCNTMIPVGSAATKVSGVWEGDFFAVYVHTACDDAWRRDPCNADGEGCSYEHRYGMTCVETEEAARHAQHEEEH